MRHLTQKAAIPCSLLVVLFASTGVSAAQATSEVPTARVSLAGLDLAQRQGVELLYARIRSAARQVCAPVAASESYPFAQLAEQRCIDNATARAVSRVNSPMLTAIQRHEASPTMIAQK